MKKMIFKRLIFLFVFIELALGATYYFSMKNMPKQTEISEVQDIKSEELENVKTVSLDETYDLNDLKITKYEHNFIEDIEYEYYQIDGLKDESIEISINYSLKSDLEDAINEVKSRDDYAGELFTNAMTYSSFSNVLSLCYYISYLTTDDMYEDTYVVENFDLTTGNRLLLSDVVVNTAGMRQFLSSKLYTAVVSSTATMNFTEDVWFYEIEDYNDVEEEIFKIINNFRTGKEITFAFTEKELVLLDYGATIYLKDCIDYVTIYDKFKTDDDIFDGKYSNLKDIPTLVQREYSEYQIVEEKDNYYIDVTLMDSELSSDAIAGESSVMTEYVDKRVQELRDMAEENPWRFFIFNYAFDVYYDIDEGVYYISEYQYTLETTENSYKNNLKKAIVDYQRGMNLDEYDMYYFANLFAEIMYDYNFQNNYVRYRYDPEIGEFEVFDDFEYYDNNYFEENNTIWGIYD